MFIHLFFHITKKLTGPAKGTAQWLTSVGNEVGQVLVSVLTAHKGPGLDLMAAGLMERYRRAGVAPPITLYVDCGCCGDVGETKLKMCFNEWPNVIVRLDIWHFVQRLAVGCTTDAHLLYPTFMARMSACIFEWDADDVALLPRAKREQLMQQYSPAVCERELDRHITKAELALHCRRRTRGEEQTILLPSFGIQDPPGMPLYTETGSNTKGRLLLKTYRCARGSTSLESFHCHFYRFIPGLCSLSMVFMILYACLYDDLVSK